jgi:hypothetical protein
MSLTKFIAIGDNHGALIHRQDAESFFEFCRTFKPNLKVHLGDNFDFANLRRGADPREEGDDMEPDLTAGFMFLDRFKPNVFCLGNHDWRLWKAMQDARGLVRQFAKDTIGQIDKVCKKMRCDVLPYHSRQGVYRVGKLAFLHGYHAGVGAIAQHARIYRSCILGHLHSNGTVSERGVDSPVAHCVGGLGDHSKMEYAAQRTATLAWGPGWAYGVINEKTGNYIVWIASKLDGRWLIPENVKAI